MIDSGPAPSDRLASTNSCWRSEITWPRMTRPIVVQLKKTMTPMLSERLGPKTETSANAQSRNGTLITRSIARLSTASTLPPK